MRLPRQNLYSGLLGTHPATTDTSGLNGREHAALVYFKEEAAFP